MPLTPAELARYSRHLSLREIGLAGQEKLKAARVLVIGAGGLGSPALLYLAAAGVGTLGIVDFDRVDVSNLQRQVLFDTNDVGSSKAVAARARLLALNPQLRVELHGEELRASNALDIIGNYDVILDGTDRFATRYLVNDACVLLAKPLVSAAIHRFEGQAFTYLPKLGPCYRCLFPEPPPEGAVPNCAEAGVLGVLPGVMGTLQATEAIKCITGVGELLAGRLLTYDALDMRFGELKFSARPDCAVCGAQPSITSLQDAPIACAADAQPVDQITAAELHARLRDANTPLRLIDVREPYEYAAGHIEGAQNIPLGELKAASASELGLVEARTLVFVCHGGGRSTQACEWAHTQGLEQILNLQGGMLAWHQAIDPQITVA
jgi:adenylyltransferase/sulfurtransferase